MITRSARLLAGAEGSIPWFHVFFTIFALTLRPVAANTEEGKSQSSVLSLELDSEG